MVRLSVSSLVDSPAAVFSKPCTPALASLKADCASWICFCTERMLRAKLSLLSDSDTTRSRSVSLKRGSPAFIFADRRLTKRAKQFILCINQRGRDVHAGIHQTVGEQPGDPFFPGISRFGGHQAQRCADRG